ncbi:hemicentin-1-like isoform X3 [Xenia sp. Carnegie-2017]|uniref:hemicentin-1-like isoform X3 n=1 Tax=Xenia sp. Carnegie-2017 TaxID=2897299 RepID=UPI001F0505BC|nr:hemicentin-1-like isoform X3 [Xenia sp. Carnegie-2017]
MRWKDKVVTFLCAAFLQVTTMTNTKFKDKVNSSALKDGEFVKITDCSKPVFLRAGLNATVYCNATVILDCNVNGKKLNLTTWFSMGEKLAGGEDGRLVINVFDGGDGMYTCISQKNDTNISTTTFIKHKAPRVPTIHGDTKSLIFTADFKIFPVIVGSNVTAYGKCLLKIVCNVSGDPRPFIMWSKSGGKIERKFIRGENLLLPRNVASSGRYICKAVNAFGFAELTSDIRFVEPIPPNILASKEIKTAVHGEDNVGLTIGDDVTTIAGTDVLIRCSTRGKPMPKLSWLYNGRPCIHCVPNQKMNSYEFPLNKRAIQSNQSGNYTCVATNAFGASSVSSHVEVIEPMIPYINSSSEDLVVYDMSFPILKMIGGSITTIVGCSFILQCQFRGVPRPKITWKKGNLRMVSSKRINFFENRVEVRGSMMSDTGWYSCTASNGAGTVTRSTFVKLLVPTKPRISVTKFYKPFLANDKPTPLHIGVGINLVIMAYRELTLYCRARGFPPPVVSWEKNGFPLQYNENVVVSRGGSKLVFRRLLPSQSGNYTCIASNAAGEDRRKTELTSLAPYKAKLIIKKSVSQSFQLSPPNGNIRSSLQQEQSYLSVQSTVTLECIAKKSYPEVRFQWFKDNRLERRRTIEVPNKSKLVLQNVTKSDEGLYKCVAKNYLERHEKTIRIILRGASGSFFITLAV